MAIEVIGMKKLGFDNAGDKLADEIDTSLDPKDWSEIRSIGHKMLDTMLDHLAGIRENKLWQAPTNEAKAAFNAPLPLSPSSLEDSFDIFKENILPFHSGNKHPGFMGWVQGGGTVTGMLAEMLAAGMNPNVGGRNHIAIEVEAQIAKWAREIFHYPETSHGIFFTGASQANFVAVLVARSRALGIDVRKKGVNGGKQLIGYASAQVHGCVPRAFEMSGIGSDNLRRIKTNEVGEIDINELKHQIEKDIAAGFQPFMIIASAGTVNMGAIDDFDAISQICQEKNLYFHIDGALGAIGMISEKLAPLFKGIEKSDSIAFDFHKWAQVPYDAGFLLAKNGQELRSNFAQHNSYLSRASKGLAGGDMWPCDYGPDLSRGFKALKTWFTLNTYGLNSLAASFENNHRLAQLLKSKIINNNRLELLTPVKLTIACFRYVTNDLNKQNMINEKIIEQLQIEGVVAPSLTVIDGKSAIRASIINHRTKECDIENLIEGVLRLGKEFEKG